jgi:heme-degrading monooxygenase HmoA
VHARVFMLAGDPARIGEVIRHVEEVRLDIENQRGSRGSVGLVNADLGTCVVASFWESLDAMTSSERAVQLLGRELVERVQGTLTVEHYEVPVLVRRSRPRDGAAAGLSHFDVAPADIDSVIERFRDAGVPALRDTPGFCNAQMMTDRPAGRCIVATAWENVDAMRAGRPDITQLRARVAAGPHMNIRSVEEYSLAFSSMRDGIALDGPRPPRLRPSWWTGQSE